MKKSQIKVWLSYWKNAKVVAVEEMKTLADVATARKFCSVMRTGVFVGVTMKQFWKLLSRDPWSGKLRG